MALFGPELARAQQVRLGANATDQPGIIVATILQTALAGEMTPEEAQRLGGVVETLVVGRKLDEDGSAPLTTLPASPAATLLDEARARMSAPGYEPISASISVARERRHLPSDPDH